MGKRGLIFLFALSIVFQLMMSVGLYLLVYVEPIPELIKTGTELLQSNAFTVSSASGPNLVRSFIMDTINAEQATATLLSTIATALLVCALIQSFVLAALLQNLRKAH